jgi:hypothetical protein
MKLELNELYKEIFTEHRFAAEFRLKLAIALAVSYGALAVVFAWIHANSPALGAGVAILAMVVTALFWAEDRRRRIAGRRANLVGAGIEALAELPAELRFFTHINMRRTLHSHIVDVFCLVMLLGLVSGAAYLLWSNGALP